MKFLKNSVKIIISILLIILLLYYIGPKVIFDAIKEINLLVIPIIILILILTIFVFALRIYYLTKAINKNVNLKNISKYSFLAWCLGSFSPARIGEIILIKSLKKENIKLGSASAVFIIDKIMSVLAISLVSLLGFIFLTSFKENILFMILVIVAVFIFFMIFTSRFGIDIAKKFLFKSITQKFVGFSRTIRLFKTKKKLFILQNLLLNIIQLFIRACVIFILFLSLDVNIPFLTIVTINAIVTLAAFIPISFSGLGIREASAVVLFSSLNYGTDKIAAVYLIAAFLTYFTAAIMLPFLINKKI